MIEITFENFKKEISDCKIPVLLFFYTDAHTLPDLTEAKEKYADKFRLCKTNLETNGAIFASLYGILSVPTVIILEKGKETARFCPAYTLSELNEFLATL